MEAYVILRESILLAGQVNVLKNPLLEKNLHRRIRRNNMHTMLTSQYQIV